MSFPRAVPRALGVVISTLLALVAMVLPTHLAWAQQAQVTSGLTTDVVEVGEGFYVELRVTTQGSSTVSSPNLVVPPAFSASGPSTTKTGVSMSFGQGPTQLKRTFTARWFVVANQTGTFTLSNPTIIVDGDVQTASGQLKVRVVPVGQGPKKAKPSPRGSPFGGFGSFFGGPRFDLSPPDDEPLEPEDLEPKGRSLMLRTEPDPWVFVRTKADKQRAVVGEPVILECYIYYRDDIGTLQQQGGVREPSLADFLRLDADGPPLEPAVRTIVGDHEYRAKLANELVVVPLRSGQLHIGRYEATFLSRRFRGNELVRTSNDLVIDVREPPLDGRPSGYRVGDVGTFRIQAEVKPRETTAGDTVSVLVRVAGRGVVPSQLDVPERAGVEWLDPVKKEDINVHGGRVGGWRSFGYAVRIREEGEVDLGTIELPFWDPSRERYEVATAELGKVTVKPAASPAPDPSAAPEGEGDDDPFAKLPPVRAEPRAFEPRGDEGFDPRQLWALVLAPPIAVAVAQLGAGAVATARRRRRDRKDDPAVLARRALADAKAQEDAKDAAAAAERAVHLALEAASGIKSRGLLLGELAGALTDAGLAADHAREAVSILDGCSALRFEPDPDEEAGADLVARAGKLVAAVLA